VIAAADLDLGDPGERPGPDGVRPGLRGAGDDVRGPVREQNAPAGQLIDRLAGRQPGRQTRHRRHGGMPGRAQRGSGAHGMPDQDDGNGPELTAQIVQVLAEVADRGGLRAVPALDPEPRPAHHHAAAGKRAADHGGHRDHPQHGGLNRTGRSSAGLPAAVRDDDHSPD